MAAKYRTHPSCCQETRAPDTRIGCVFRLTGADARKILMWSGACGHGVRLSPCTAPERDGHAREKATVRGDWVCDTERTVSYDRRSVSHALVDCRLPAWGSDSSSGRSHISTPPLASLFTAFVSHVDSGGMVEGRFHAHTPPMPPSTHGWRCGDEEVAAALVLLPMQPASYHMPIMPAPSSDWTMGGRGRAPDMMHPPEPQRSRWDGCAAALSSPEAVIRRLWASRRRMG